MSGLSKKILFISHDASRTGAPAVLLNLIRWISTNTNLNFRILLRSGGALEFEFRALGETHILNDAQGNPAFVQDVGLIYSNTCTNGDFIETLPYGTIPVITHVHEMPAVIDSYGAANFRAVRRQTTHFIACSQAVLNGLKGFGIAANRISTIHESVPISLVRERAIEKSCEQIKTWHGWEGYDSIVAGCGVAEWRKGADLFVQLANQVKSRLGQTKRVLFLWIGILPPDERGKLLRNDVRQLGLEDTVCFLGEVTNPAPFLNGCDVFCLTSREDPFPLVMLEAACLGKPIVCFEKSGGGEEFSRLGGAKSVTYLDVNAMADAVLELVQGGQKGRDLGDCAKKLVQENFDISVTAPKIVCEIEKHGARTSGPSLGYAQVYFPASGGYSESNSTSLRVPPGRWTRFRVELPSCAAVEQCRVRLDPIAGAGLSEITGVTFKDPQGKILWRHRCSDAQNVTIENAVPVPGSRCLRMVSHDTDPRLYINIPESCKAAPLILEWWQRSTLDPQEIAIACRDLHEPASGKPVKNPKSLRFLQKFLKT